MSKQYTYEQVAKKLELWQEYVDPEATMTDDEFEQLTTEEKIQIQVDCFGKEESEAEA